jgi:hypothetical protein
MSIHRPLFTHLTSNYTIIDISIHEGYRPLCTFVQRREAVNVATIADDAISVHSHRLLLVALLLVLLGKMFDTVLATLVTEALARARPWLRKQFFAVFLCWSKPTPRARRLAARIQSRFPGLPGIELLNPADHRHGVREVLVIAMATIWEAYKAERRKDRGVQLGMWLRLTGVLATASALADPRPGLGADLGLAIAVVLAGHYLGGLHPHPASGFALLAIGPFAVLFALHSDDVWPARAAQAVGAAGATAASLAIVFDIAAKHVRPRRHRQRRALRAARHRAIGFGMRAATVACWSYAVVHVVQAATSPRLLDQAVHVAVALLLGLVSRHTHERPSAYRRLAAG